MNMHSSQKQWTHTKCQTQCSCQKWADVWVEDYGYNNEEEEGGDDDDDNDQSCLGLKICVNSSYIYITTSEYYNGVMIFCLLYLLHLCFSHLKKLVYSKFVMDYCILNVNNVIETPDLQTGYNLWFYYF